MKNDKSKDKGPLDVITEKGAIVSIYATPTKKGGKVYQGHTLIYTAAGRRKRQFVADLEKARETATTIARQLGEGVGHAHTLTPAQVADHIAAAQAAQKLGRRATLAEIVGDYVAASRSLPEGVTLRDAVAEYRKTHDRAAQLSSATVEDVKTRFLTSRENAGASDRYQQDIRVRLTAFAKAFRCQISSVTAAEITVWLDSIGAKGRTRNNYRCAVITLFRFACKQGNLPRNEVTEAELVETVTPKPTKIGIYTPDQLRLLLDAMPESLLPSVAIAALAGVRSQEVLRLTWDDVDLRKKQITVAAEKAKTASRRLVPILPALADWLRDHPNRKGPIVTGFSYPSGWNRAVSREVRRFNIEAKEANGPQIPRIQNGLRHSFASYRLAIVKSAPEVALEMGNSVKKLMKNYRELVTNADARRWFAVKPQQAKGKKVIPFREAVA
jgi:integrase